LETTAIGKKPPYSGVGDLKTSTFKNPQLLNNSVTVSLLSRKDNLMVNTAS